jgi:hypothetical protein
VLFLSVEYLAISYCPSIAQIRRRGMRGSAYVVCAASPFGPENGLWPGSSGPHHVNQGRCCRVLISMRTYIIDASRGLAAAGVFLAAVVHLDLWVEGFRSISTIGPLFMLDFVAGMIIGVGVLVWRHWLPALAAAGFGVATVIAFWISVVHGLFGVKETTSGSSEILAEIAEYSAIVFGLAVVVMLLLPRHPRPTNSRVRSTSARPPAFTMRTHVRR